MNKKPQKHAKSDKSSRGNASQFFVAGELCRRGLVAVVTIGNTPNTDILCSNADGTKFVHIQVKTFVPGSATVSVGKKAERLYGDGERFVWVLAGIPTPDSEKPFVYYVIPSREVARNVSAAHKLWLKTLGKNGRHIKTATSERFIFRRRGRSADGTLARTRIVGT
jgi:hypothetical protein